MDPDADTNPAIFVIDFQDANKKLVIKKIFCFYFLQVHLSHFSKIKSQKEVIAVGSKVFFTFFDW
jgi:hypothetical protein